MPQPHQKRRPQSQRASRPNKAQQREAQVRAQQMATEPAPEVLATAATVADDAGPFDREQPGTPASDVATPVAAATGSAQPARRRDARGRAASSRRPAAAPAAPAVTREQEYQFIRADLRRLLITAGTVLVLMLALLFVVEG